MVDAYLYNSCSSCRKAEDVLKDAGVTYTKHEYFKQKLGADEIAELCGRIGITPSELVATRSTPYKTERLAQQEISDAEWTERMSAEPRLIRRPLIVRGNQAVIGFDEARIRALVGGES